jgi:hypothetical protein
VNIFTNIRIEKKTLLGEEFINLSVSQWVLGPMSALSFLDYNLLYIIWSSRSIFKSPSFQSQVLKNNFLISCLVYVTNLVIYIVFCRTITHILKFQHKRMSTIYITTWHHIQEDYNINHTFCNTKANQNYTKNTCAHAHTRLWHKSWQQFAIQKIYSLLFSH